MMAALGVSVTAPFSRPAVRRALCLTSDHGHHLAIVSHVPGSTLSTPLIRSVREFKPRRLLALPARASSTDVNRTKNSDGKKDLYILLAVCVAVKLYAVFKEKASTLMMVKMSEKYITVAITVFAILKAIYQSLKLAKEIRELVKYYLS